jgi:SNF2 family DNA or RNA helicase
VTLVGGYSELAQQKPLHEYQRHAVDWLLKKLFVEQHPGVALFLDPGLGKTRITLTLLDLLFKMNEIQRVLIVAPLRPVYTVWGPEICKWGFPPTSVILHKQHAKGMALKRHIELVNFEGLVKLKDIQNRWDMIVIDESTAFKNWSAKRTKYAKQMVQTIPRRLELTGTPTANSLKDLFAQIYLLDQGRRLGRSQAQFHRIYCRQGGGWQNRDWVVRKAMRDMLVSAVSDIALRMKAEDYIDMPRLVRNDIWVDLPPTAMAKYAKLKKELYAELETGEVFAANAASAYGKCRQFAGGQIYATTEDGDKIKDGCGGYEYHITHRAKLHALAELSDELNGKPLLIFYHFQHELKEIRKLEAFKNVPVMTEIKTKDLERFTQEWNAGSHRAALCQWQSASHGLNLQNCCQDVACFGMTDMAEVFDQAIRRVWRQGNDAPQVRIHRILAKNTIDELQLERMDGKNKTQAEFLSALKRHAKS